MINAFGRMSGRRGTESLARESRVACGTVGAAAGRCSRGMWLLVVIALMGCERTPDDPPPDMSMVRGDPIEVWELADGSDGLDGLDGLDESDGSGFGWGAGGDGPILVGFDRLAGFEYEVSGAGEPAEESATSQIPSLIRELDGREVGVKGFMLPVKVEGGMVREFLLMRDQSMCCFGVMPKVNEWVAVTMAGRGVRAMMDQPVTVFGTLRVGEVYEHGVLAGIYHMTGVEMAGPLDL
jgi:hypothetical protein